MNGNPYTTPYIGSTGTYPINELIKTNSNLNYLYTSNSSNNNYKYSYNSTSNLSYQLYNLNQYINPYPIIYKDTSNSTVLKITGYDTTSEIKFDTMAGNQVITKIDKDGKLMIYHPVDPTLPNRSAGWWYIHDELAQRERDTIGLRIDMTEQQFASGANSTAIGTHTGQINTLTLGLNGLTATTIPTITANVTALQTSKQDKITTIAPLNLNTTTNNLSLNYNTNDFVINSTTSNLELNYNTLSNIYVNSNVLRSTSNQLYNYTSNSSNSCILYTNSSSNSCFMNCSNLIYITSNNLYNNVGNVNLTNYYTKTQIDTNINTAYSNASNYTFNSSNSCISYTNLSSNSCFMNCSNLTYITSNSLYNNIGNINTSLANYYTKTQTDTNINTAYLNASNYTSNTSNSLFNDISLLKVNRPKISNITFTTTTAITYGGNTYYSYDINISQYVNYINTSSLNKLTLFSIYTRLTSGAIDPSNNYESYYKVLLSYRTNNPFAGLNIKTLTGYPQDDFLTIVQPWKVISVDGNPYYLTYLSNTNGASIIATIINEF